MTRATSQALPDHCARMLCLHFLGSRQASFNISHQNEAIGAERPYRPAPKLATASKIPRQVKSALYRAPLNQRIRSSHDYKKRYRGLAHGQWPRCLQKRKLAMAHKTEEALPKQSLLLPFRKSLPSVASPSSHLH